MSPKSRNDEQGQPYVQKGSSAPPASWPPVPNNAGGPGQSVGTSQKPVSPGESHIGNVTIFRTAQFFVHAVARRTSGLQNASGNTTLLEQIRWVSTERQKVTDAETRLLPDVDQINPVLQREIIIPLWFEALVVIIGLGIAMAVHGINLFGFPSYQQGEGILMSNAWAILHGQLEPNTYNYDQTPLGWILIAGWAVISGGFATFGNAINSGRALMLLFSFGSSLLVYLIARRLSGSRGAGLLAVLLFTLSPLGITFQREVVLENIGIFWLLLSLHLVVSGNSRLQSLVLAGVSLGIAILTKEIFLIFFPVMFYAVSLHATTFQRKFALMAFLYIVLALTSLFALFAILKGELLPGNHPSLWAGIVNHIQTAVSESDFSGTWKIWMQGEMPLFIASAVAVVVNMLGGSRNRLQWLLAFLLLSIWIFILSTNIIFPSYFVILLPLMAINIAMAINAPIRWLSKRIGFDIVRVLLIFGIIGALVPYRVQSTHVLTTQDAIRSQVNALTWIRQHVPQNATVVANSYLYADLHEPAGSGGKVYDHAQFYLDVVHNPDIRFTVLHDNWEKIDYIVADQQILQDVRNHPADMILLDRAFHHATLQQEFRADNNDPQTSVQIYQINHTNA
ncbi:MAG TPA: glycosyltransferase family 39 protein [Ktedonobacteraceae bacterium]|nr:glycosyltransferase family 39 protein [Ktedonobacteraceae bacterium]